MCLGIHGFCGFVHVLGGELLGGGDDEKYIGRLDPRPWACFFSEDTYIAEASA